MSSTPPSSRPTLGTLLKGLRAREGWTLKEMSAKSGIPVSTLSKIEHDRLTLTYDKLQQLGQRLGMRMSDLFAEGEDDTAQPVTARRSLSDIERAVRVETPNYDYYYLCTELRRKRMVPVVTKIRARSSEQFGDLVRHSGEEFLYVLSGRVVVQTQFYDPVTLEPGQALYIDSSMGHAYLAAEGCDEAEVLAVMSSEEEELMQSLLTIHEEQRQGAVAVNENGPDESRSRCAGGRR
ncbi:transcriptional regulator, XRE family with cupin sensor [Sphingomonas gellani]|uniref:Transcriptional regulator, XRE family with cupin sensor n=1 Tax=Sphingomonas gellani TaxID=1166340 RepID=A0A1H8ALU6_9SPHN|nr:XRE family transcriptional regulator [Sphingomonas gellani]SEM71725.1 transcriptional regulator, XRE family with cupin sensor [Sphingomonas gellani]